VPILATAAWVGGLVAVIGFAVIGGEPAADPVVPPPPGPVLGEVSATAVPQATAPRPAVRPLLVEGRVARNVGEVWLVLVTMDGTDIAAAPLDPTGHGHGAWIPFESRLLVSRAAADVGVPLFVRTVSPTGRRLDTTRHPFTSSLFLVVGPDGSAMSAGSLPSVGSRLSAGAPRGFPSSSPVSVFGRSGSPAP
jgi:hypothetical protein